ncbi:RNA-binding protein [Spiroplasma gladiatoris]|uniref:RNA-binding protein n=1 Tax=Spiroplasma gladiatoris TaxID=2143 RepID=A0A4P7AGH5_9MOLU|nr:ASCH domain-containing protein [Spiroplasma gladiatoris]QBQ07484.1 RNA-binding protein [Spiroplasma gladiatoris]
MNKKIEDFWLEFIDKNNLEKIIKYSEYFYFGHTEELANNLLELVLSGKKKATSSVLKQFEIEKESLPEIGEYSIVTDYYNNPRCVIRTTNVRLIKYKNMTFEICKLEGEDKNLESWNYNHELFLKRIAKENNFEFNDELIIVFEEFELVYKKS